MKFDSIGIMFAGLAIVFLVASMVGNRKREHLSNETNVWDSIRVATERILDSTVDYDVAKFRKETLNQNAFFDAEEATLAAFEKGIGLSMGPPSGVEVKRSGALFDEKLRLFEEDKQKQLKKKGPDSLKLANQIKLAAGTLRSLAQNYMLNIAIENGAKPKSGGTLSKLFG